MTLHTRTGTWSNTPAGSRGRLGQTLTTDAEGRVEFEVELFD